MREREKSELRKRWNRKEESDFYRTLITYGVDFSDKKFSWTRFRQLAKIEKSEDTITEYFLAYVAMCKKIVGQKLSEEEGNFY